MQLVDFAAPSAPRAGRWSLVYCTVGEGAALAAQHRGPRTFGCTSSGGVFTPRGFERGAFALVAGEEDPRAEVVVRACTAATARASAREATKQLVERVGRRPDALLLHATPGFEERLLEGIDEAFAGDAPPAYGGSAADDDLSGKWSVFAGSQVVTEGFLLVAFTSPRPIHGSFVAGYLPGKQRGTITRVSGRVVHEIDRRPAAEVYDQWVGGMLGDALTKPRTVLADTTLHPVGRLVDRVGNYPRYLLSHPHEVRADRGLSFFTELAVGDELALMIGSEDGLMERTEQVVSRALGAERDARLAGGVLIYCGGCVMAIGARAAEVGTMYHRAIGGAPFVGAATFGEVGCFRGPKPLNRHGNLMCDTILFE